MGLDPAVARRFPIEVAPGVELRRYALDDAAELYAVVAANRERLNRWMPWSDGVREVAHQRAWVEQHLDDVEGVGLFVEGTLVGGVGMSHDPFLITGEIGYWIDGAYEGRGYVTAAVRAMIDLGFRDLRLHRIVIRAGVDNRRSRAIPERLGFTLEGEHRGEGSGSGGHGFYDMVVYGLLEDEWPPAE